MEQADGAHYTTSWDTTLAGADIFITHRKSEAAAYAKCLNDRLQGLGFRCFLDEGLLSSGESLDRCLREARRTRMLLVIGTPTIMESEWVSSELDAYDKAHRRGLRRFWRRIIVINVDGAMDRFQSQFAKPEGMDTPWHCLFGLVSEPELGSAIRSGEPSSSVIERIRSSFRLVRGTISVLGSLAAAIVAVAGTVAIIILSSQQLISQLSVEQSQLKSDISNHRAEKAQLIADKSTLLSDKARLEADVNSQRNRVTYWEGQADRYEKASGAWKKRAASAQIEATRQQGRADRFSQIAMAEEKRANNMGSIATARERAYYAQQTIPTDPLLALTAGVQGFEAMNTLGLNDASVSRAVTSALFRTPSTATKALIQGTVDSVVPTHSRERFAILTRSGRELNTSVSVFDAASTRLSRRIDQTGWPGIAALSSNGDFLVLCTVAGPARTQVQTWSVQTGLPIGSPLIYQDFITSVVITPDDRFIALAIGGDRVGVIKNPRFGASEPVIIANELRVRDLAINGPGTLLFAAGLTQVWEISLDLQGHLSPVWRCSELPRVEATVTSVSPLGPRFIIDRTGNTVALRISDGAVLWKRSKENGWNGSKFALGSQRGPGQSFNSVLLTPDGSTLLVSTVMGHIVSWDTSTGMLLANTERRFSARGSSTWLDITPDGQYLLQSTGPGQTVAVLHVDTLEEVVASRLMGLARLAMFGHQARSIIAILQNSNEAEILRLDDGPRQNLGFTAGQPLSIEVCPSGKWIAVVPGPHFSTRSEF